MAESASLYVIVPMKLNKFIVWFAIFLKDEDTII